MSSDETVSPRSPSTLGQHLAAIRLDRGLSLRQVEELTHKVVSNAYLSQIENNKIQQPSPNILHALAQVYKVSYQQLMEMAGYVTGNNNKDAVHGRAATFAALNMTEAEETELLGYLKFMRQTREKTGEIR